MSLKVYVDGGSPDNSLYADGLLISQLSENEFIILGLNLGEGAVGEELILYGDLTLLR